jgi:lipocalin-like protein
MDRRACVGAFSTALLSMTLVSGDAASQQGSIKDQLVGAWTLVSINRSATFGSDPKGVAFFDGSGHFIIAVMRSDRPKYAINDRAQGTIEENKATAQGTLTYFGTYSINEADHVIAVHVVSSSFPNWDGADQKRIFTLAGDELKLANRVASAGEGTTEVTFKRAR